MLKRRLIIFFLIPIESIRSLGFFLERAFFGHRRRRNLTPQIQNSLLGAASVRAAFDYELKEEFSSALTAANEAIATIIAADSRIARFSEKEKFRHAIALAMIQKSINDLIATTELLRLGYISNSMAGLRTVLESHSMAILIILDKNIANQFMANRFAIQDAFSKSLGRKELNISAETQHQLRAIYKELSEMTHPSWSSVKSHLVGNRSEFSVGGAFDSAKLRLYQHHIDNLRITALNITASLRSAYGIGP